MGKAMLIYVVGMIGMVGYMLLSINQRSLNSMDAYTSYFVKAASHNIALAGANIVTQYCIKDPLYTAGISNKPFNGGTFSATVAKLGDTTRITSISIFRFFNPRKAAKDSLRDTIQAIVRKTSFAKYGYFTESEGGAAWATGDSIFGLAHTNGQFGFYGRPYFDSKVTGTTAAKYWSGATPILNGGYQWGISVPRPASTLTDLVTKATSLGGLISAGGNDVKIVFLSNGKVGVKIPASTGATRNDTLPLASVAPAGIIVVNNGNIRVQGTYQGAVTIAAAKGSYSDKGNVYIESNNLIAATNPVTNPLSPDMLGIVAEKNVIVAKDLTRNSSTVVNIQATIYSQTGKFIPEDYVNLPNSGRININGGIIANTCAATATYNSSGQVTHGFSLIVRFDSRFTTKAPPLYPTSPKYELVSWWEN